MSLSSARIRDTVTTWVLMLLTLGAVVLWALFLPQLITLGITVLDNEQETDVFIELVGAGALISLSALCIYLWSVVLANRSQRNTYRTAKRQLAQMILNRDTLEVTYGVVSAEHRTPALEDAWAGYVRLSAALLTFQEDIDRLPVASERYALQVEQYAEGVARLQYLENAIVGSSDFWGQGDTARTTFDILLRPIDALVREQLHFLEDQAPKGLSTRNGLVICAAVSKGYWRLRTRLLGYPMNTVRCY